MSRYGELPKVLGEYKVDCKEMMFYQYLPIKLSGTSVPMIEKRLQCFNDLIGVINCDFIGLMGLDKYIQSYVYVTAKYMYQPTNTSFNRPGWHCDGFMTDDINYIWSDKYPTVFNTSKFNLTMDDRVSMTEMWEQATPSNNISYPENSLIRLNEYNVHRPAVVENPGYRTFLKVSFSEDKYDLIGNAHNYDLDYDWEMKERKTRRNIPQSK